jgi:hypothetical protein
MYQDNLRTDKCDENLIHDVLFIHLFDAFLITVEIGGWRLKFEASRTNIEIIDEIDFS